MVSEGQHSTHTCACTCKHENMYTHRCISTHTHTQRKTLKIVPSASLNTWIGPTYLGPWVLRHPTHTHSVKWQLQLQIVPPIPMYSPAFSHCFCLPIGAQITLSSAACHGNPAPKPNLCLRFLCVLWSCNSPHCRCGFELPS